MALGHFPYFETKTKKNGSKRMHRDKTYCSNVKINCVQLNLYIMYDDVNVL